MMVLQQYLHGMARIVPWFRLFWRNRRYLSIVLVVIMLWIVSNYVKRGMYLYICVHVCDFVCHLTERVSILCLQFF